MGTVSVIIPVYKTEKYIATAIESVLEQTYQNFEVLIIDDGSPDRSVEIARQYMDRRIQIIQQENRGLAGARNTGIRHAKGEYLAFLDSDDLWMPEKLEKHIDHFNNSPDVGVSFSRSALIDEAGNRLGTYLRPKLCKIDLSDLFRCNVVGNGSAALARKSVLDAIQFKKSGLNPDKYFYFDEDLRRNEDYELWLRIAITTNWKIEGIPDDLTLYRVNPLGLSSNFAKQLDSWKQVLDNLHSYAPEIMAHWEKPAMSYHLRYLARSAVRLGVASEAVSLIHQALLAYWPIILEEPRRTFSILIAAYVLKLTQL